VIRAFRAIASGVDQSTRYFGPLAVANLIATILSIPLILLAALAGSFTGSWPILLLTATLLIAILPSPATAGLQNLAHGFAHSVPLIGVSDIRAGYRAYGVLAFKVWLLSIAGTIVILGNMAFYLTLSGTVAAVLRVLWLYIVVIWLGAQLYVYPLLVEQRDKRVVLIFRNAILMSCMRPIFTAIVGIVWVLVVAVTFATGLAAVFGLGLAAAIQQNATAVLLPTFDESVPAE
jgi:uncharacterized membrane protein YesL